MNQKRKIINKILNTKEEFSEIRKELEKMLPPEKYFLDWESEVGGYEKIEAIDLIMDLFESKLSLVKKEAEARGFKKGRQSILDEWKEEQKKLQMGFAYKK
jgi:hypothetical protein